MSSPYWAAASPAISQLAMWPPNRITRRPAASARSRCSMPRVSTRLPGSNTRICRRCGYSAATRPRLSHMPRTIASIRGSDISGKAARRLRRARSEIARRGAIRHARKPPSAEAAASGRQRRIAMDAAAPQASNRCVQETGAAAGSAASGARVASITGLRQKRVQYPVEHYRVAPADLDVEHFDAGPPTRMQPPPILCRRDELRVSPRCRFAKAGDLVGAVRVMVRKALCRGQLRAEAAQGRKEFLGPADPGKGDDARISETLAVHRFHGGPQHRAGYTAQLRRYGRIADQHERIGAGEPRRNRLTQWPGRHDPAVAEAVFGIDDDQ